MDAKRLERYLKWCKEKRYDPMSEKSLKEFTVMENYEKEQKEKKEQNREELTKKQKAIFELMVDYTGIKVDYDKDIFDAFDSLIKSAVNAARMVKMIDDVMKEEK